MPNFFILSSNFSFYSFNFPLVFSFNVQVKWTIKIVHDDEKKALDLKWDLLLCVFISGITKKIIGKKEEGSVYAAIVYDCKTIVKVWKK